MAFWDIVVVAVAIAWGVPIIVAMAVLLYRAATWHRR